MTYEQILVDRNDRVGILTLNSPDRLNAWTNVMAKEIRDAIESFNNDDSIGAVVMTGAGRAFCAGADIKGWDKQIAESEENGDRPRANAAAESFVHFIARSKPIICAINGVSIGVGLTITLPCDVRIASEDARLAMRFIRIGVLPELASTKILAHIVGMTHALELMLSGRIIPAEEAGRIGLVNRVVPADRLMDEAMETAAEIAFNPADSIKAVKSMFWENLQEPTIEEAMKREGREFNAAMERPYFKEAVHAFLEKRQPDFHKV
ncbi:MAG: enoyl-CoA hydratase/isomerase family protein [Chloroflexi bacterium]|nr:enoyl-CoA hydratase/isomerase family protein [Chloroflexota bacterium]